MKIIDVINEMLKAAPSELQLDYDNSGLQVGDVSQDVKNVMVALDVNADTIKKAAIKGVNLIISHHPMIFKPVKKVDARETAGKMIIGAIKSDICVFSRHTNFDTAFGGLNDILAERLGVSDTTPLVSLEDKSMCKLVVFVPIGYEEALRQALFSIGAGVVGDYPHCSFGVRGEGTFAPPESSNPFTGEKGRDNTVNETRLEMVLPCAKLDKAASVIAREHPYEEPAYDIYPLTIKRSRAGLGRVGKLSAAMTLRELGEMVKEKLKITHLRYIGNPKAKIRRVALCGGSGGSLISAAISSGAEAYITGDIKYHEALDAKDAKLNIIDAGHFSTEMIFVEHVRKSLNSFFTSTGNDVKVFSYKSSDPFGFFV